MWKKLPCAAKELNLNVTLSCGQSFRWKKLRENTWIGVLKDHVWTLFQCEDEILYMIHHEDEVPVTNPAKKRKKTAHAKMTTKDKDVLTDEMSQNILRDYFQLEVNLQLKYEEWSASDDHFKKVASSFHGVRMLRQDPVETLFCFICSSNNNISRITSMVDKLCQHYGKPIVEVDGQMYHAFPTVEALAEPGIEDKLRTLGFGYRAKYISQTAQQINKREDKADWLHKLRSTPYETAFQQLQELSGVGAKVADCICLMSLNKCEAVPVDTHVYQIARQHYIPHLPKKKSLTTATYKEVGDCFRLLFGAYAGWAHSVLFSSELKKFSNKQT